eukprot:TRINITY_DN2362_c0_g1_i12.p2 TRINITY_DN2362_c0_g1~~TRINITY_DN2362_c0_g1_i12.p2  ORF type:complete len:105 (-),score=42.89 TRINITY_DN2362_c0_g1_i12:10-324(-)
MNKSFLTLTLTLFLPFTLANYDFPAVNFTMNFLGNIGMERITGDYAMCHANVNESLYSALYLSLIHISEPTRPLYISYAVFCLKKKKKKKKNKKKKIQKKTQKK